MEREMKHDGEVADLHELARAAGSRSGSTRSRATLVQTGELQRMMDEDAVTGVTSNPTIFQKALAEGDDYDEQLQRVLDEIDDPREIFFRLALRGHPRRVRRAAAGVGRAARARTATSRWRSTRRSPTTPRRRSSRRSGSRRRSTGRTCW